jgi:4'-phosphopantetheinyl transferase EntD
LFPEEQVAIARAVEKRRSEYTTGRACAHEALARLGLPIVPVRRSARGEPQWPVGVVGSITHTDNYCACAVAASTDIATIGIDAEPHAPLPPEVPVSTIARPEELLRLKRMRREAPAVHGDRLLFSVKEAVFKAWYPLTGRELDFDETTVAFDVQASSFTATLLVACPEAAGISLEILAGRWLVRDSLVLTAVTLAPIPGA